MEKTYNGKNETEMQLRNYFTWHLEHFVHYMKNWSALYNHIFYENKNITSLFFHEIILIARKLSICLRRGKGCYCSNYIFIIYC